jgi:hypothetical protein
VVGDSVGAGVGIELGGVVGAKVGTLVGAVVSTQQINWSYKIVFAPNIQSVPLIG